MWDASEIDWAAFDLVLPRSTWDYAERREGFLAWAASVPRVLNPLEVLEWNTDKRLYLTDLDRAGVPIVPTAFVDPGGELDPPGGRFVVKPTVSAGGRSSARFEPNEVGDARRLVSRIHAEGRTAMVQPFVDGHAEKALVYLDGAYSHTVSRVVPLPAAGDREVFFLDEELSPGEATAEEREIAEAALACAPTQLLYGRVDLIGDAVLELEIAEPSLYLGFCEGSPIRFAEAIARRLDD